MRFGAAGHKYGAKPSVLCPACGFTWRPEAKDKKRCQMCGHTQCIRFASKREMARYNELRLAEKCGAISGLTLQPKFTFPMGFSYVGDFAYTEAGKSIVEDTKGVETEAFKLKRKCFAHFYPGLELRVTR